jgi:hypothetical protein
MTYVFKRVPKYLALQGLGALVLWRVVDALPGTMAPAATWIFALAMIGWIWATFAYEWRRMLVRGR